MSTYRNVFFNKSSFSIGSGSEEVYYTGKIYDNAVMRADFFQLYDKDRDLVISCNACAKKNIKFIKKAGSNLELEPQGKDHLPKTKAKITKKLQKNKVLVPIKQKKCKHC